MEASRITDMNNLKQIRFFVFDSDGVLFPNIVWEGVSIEGAPFRPKLRSYYDGQGISLMRALGIKICIITNAAESHAAGIRGFVEKLNSLPSARKSEHEGGWSPIQLFEGRGGRRKLETLQGWLQEQGGTLEESGAMGDDLVDVPMLKAVGFAAAPASAEQAIKDICHFVSERNAGEGAVRDVGNFFVAQHGKNPFELPFD